MPAFVLKFLILLLNLLCPQITPPFWITFLISSMMKNYVAFKASIYLFEEYLNSGYSRLDSQGTGSLLMV